MIKQKVSKVTDLVAKDPKTLVTMLKNPVFLLKIIGIGPKDK